MSKPVIDERLNKLFDLLMEHPEGVTKSDMAAEIGIPRDRIGRVIHAFRLEFRKQDRNLTARPNGTKEWVYTLDAESEAWAQNRIADAESRLDTMAAMMQSVVRATNPRTLAGRKARKMEVAFRHLQEDLAELVAEGTLHL